MAEQFNIGGMSTKPDFRTQLARNPVADNKFKGVGNNPFSTRLGGRAQNVATKQNERKQDRSREIGMRQRTQQFKSTQQGAQRANADRAQALRERNEDMRLALDEFNEDISIYADSISDKLQDSLRMFRQQAENDAIAMREYISDVGFEQGQQAFSDFLTGAARLAAYGIGQSELDKTKDEITKETKSFIPDRDAQPLAFPDTRTGGYAPRPKKVEVDDIFKETLNVASGVERDSSAPTDSSSPGGGVFFDFIGDSKIMSPNTGTRLLNVEDVRDPGEIAFEVNN